MKTDKRFFSGWKKFYCQSLLGKPRMEDIPEGNYKLCRKSRMAGHRDFLFQSHHFMQEAC